MSATATQLRKELFTTLDRAVQGETVEIIYKGTTILLKTAGTSKLARAVRRPTILVDPDELVESDANTTGRTDARRKAVHERLEAGTEIE
jgi:antitoxin (DNA-binding transcriptional repressor) of toxin-antitoxin stability system